MRTLRLTPLATSLGIKGVPLVWLAINTVNPSFSTDGEGFRFRVILEPEFAPGDVERIGYTRAVGHMVEIVPRAGSFRYGITFWGESEARLALGAIADLGARLDDSARRFLLAAAPDATAAA